MGKRGLVKQLGAKAIGEPVRVVVMIAWGDPMIRGRGVMTAESGLNSLTVLLGRLMPSAAIEHQANDAMPPIRGNRGTKW